MTALAEPKLAPAAQDASVQFRPIELAPGVRLHAGADTDIAHRVLTEDAVALVAELHRALQGERQVLLAKRGERQAAWDAGEVPTYLDRTSVAASGDWQVAPVPAVCSVSVAISRARSIGPWSTSMC